MCYICLSLIFECKTNPEKSSTKKIDEHVPCVYSMSATWTFDGIKNKHDIHRGENWKEGEWEHAIKIIIFEKQKMIPWANAGNESYLNQLHCVTSASVQIWSFFWSVFGHYTQC